MNTARVTRQGDSFVLADNIRWPVAEKYQSMADGDYTLGIHPHHLSLGHSHGDAITISGIVQVAEISGSESIVHVDIAGNPWVSESQGIHPFVIGETTELRMQTGRCLYFDDDGNLVAS
jgi:glycerol transport system ATP-binding protein